MLPVLFSFGPLSVSSFGFFLALAFLFATFLVWRIARAWDLDEEKILDLVLLTFFGGLIGARIFFVSLNIEFFSTDLTKAILITKYPGLSFWGGLLGGWLALSFFVARFKLDFRQIADLAAVGFLGGIIFGDIGCFLGGCDVGSQSNLFFAVPVVGVIGKRFPVQILEALALTLVLVKIWPVATHFHFSGKVVSLTLIWLGIVKFITEFFRSVHQGGYFLSIVLVVLGIFIFYRTSKKSLRGDLTGVFYSIKSLFTSGESRILLLDRLSKSWYNHRMFWISSINKTLRRMRVKPTPKDI